MTDFQSQAVLALLGILTSGIVSTVITHGLRSSRVEKEFKRQKLELLFMSTNRFTKLIHTVGMTYVVSLGGSDVKEAFQKTISQHEGKEDYEIAWMLCNIYFPELIKSFSEIVVQRDAINNVGLPIYLKKVNATPEHFVLLEKELTILDIVSNKFNELLFKSVSNL